MSPLLFLALMILVPLAVVALKRLTPAPEAKLRPLARQWGAHFAADDRFNLAPRIASQLPTPGAADVRVGNVIYVKSGDSYHFLFTVEWTSGVLRWKKRLRQVGAVVDRKPQRDRALTLRLADQNLPLERQYEQLHQSCCQNE